MESHPHDPKVVLTVGYDGLTVLWDIYTGIVVSRYDRGWAWVAGWIA